MASTYEQDIALAVYELAKAWKVSIPWEQAEIFSNLTCDEAGALIEVFVSAGYSDVAQRVQEAHATGDSDPEDAHHGTYLVQRDTGIVFFH